VVRITEGQTASILIGILAFGGALALLFKPSPGPPVAPPETADRDLQESRRPARSWRYLRPDTRDRRSEVVRAVPQERPGRPGRDRSNQTSADWVRSHYTSVVAGAMAYACYLIADLKASAPFPQFLRDHLFDGLAPAALVGVLVDLFPSENPAGAFPRIRRPITIMLMLFAAGAAIFGLIAAAAVFSSGRSDYGSPVWSLALFGGFLFGYGYYNQVGRIHGRSLGKDYWSRKMWWFGKRSP